MFRAGLNYLAICFLALAAGGCGGVHPPAKTVDPVAIYVADYGVHSAVMLPIGNNRFVEYAFGDWGYCTEKNRDGPADAIGALFVSNGSAFGRRYIDMLPGQSYPTPRSEVPKKVFAVNVSRAGVEKEEEKFAARHQQFACTVMHNPGNDTAYVRDSQHYSAVNSCNHLTASTLRDLGCKVDGPTFFSKFYLASEYENK